MRGPNVARMSSSRLAPGLLLAAPRLGDPNFVRSVVLLAQHDPDGALGWVLNGKALLPVHKLLVDADLVPPGVSLPETGSFEAQVRVGGPVMPGSAWIVYEREATLLEFDAEHDLGGGYAATGARSAIEAIARGEGPKRFRIMLGYAGWGASQLEGEIRAGAWLPADVVAALLLSEDTDTLWDAAYQSSVGTSPMAFVGATRGSA